MVSDLLVLCWGRSESEKPQDYYRNLQGILPNHGLLDLGSFKNKKNQLINYS